MLDALEVQLKEFKTNLDAEAKKEKDALQAKYDDLKKELDITADHAARLDVKLQGFKSEPEKTYDFKGAFAKSVEDQAEQIKSLSGLGSGSRGKIDLKLNLSEATGQKDIGFSVGLYDRLTTDKNFLPGVYATPFAPVWLRNILTNVPVDSNITWEVAPGACGYKISFGTNAAANNALPFAAKVPVSSTSIEFSSNRFAD